MIGRPVTYACGRNRCEGHGPEGLACARCGAIVAHEYVTPSGVVFACEDGEHASRCPEGPWKALRLIEWPVRGSARRYPRGGFWWVEERRGRGFFPIAGPFKTRPDAAANFPRERS